MATVKPFKAIRPDSELASKVAALPYDVMNSKEARELTKNNPYSFLHVDKAEVDLDPDIDLYSPQVYEKAASNLNKMIQDKVFVQDETANFYIYRLTLDGRSQTGLVACTSIDEYLNNSIKKHELTRTDKEEDRIRHVDICNANTGPIFLTYETNKEIDAIINNYIAGNEQVYDFISFGAVRHEVWVINNSEIIYGLQKLFEKVPNLYIADGHHRAASAVKVGMKRREENPGYDTNAEFNYFLAVLFPDEQLAIMDYNRVVKDLNGLSTQEFFAEIEKNFTVSKAESGKPGSHHQFGMYLGGEWYLLTAKPPFSTDVIEALDVSILQNKLLAPVLGINDPRTDKRIDFVGGIRGLKELENRVSSGEMTVAFAMFPTSIKELFDIANEDKIMPPKSTWFEPKLLSGLFIHSLE